MRRTGIKNRASLKDKKDVLHLKRYFTYIKYNFKNGSLNRAATKLKHGKEDDQC